MAETNLFDSFKIHVCILGLIAGYLGKHLLDAAGYTYRKDKRNWRCTQDRKFFCRGRVKIEGDFIIQITGHNHEPTHSFQ